MTTPVTRQLKGLTLLLSGLLLSGYLLSALSSCQSTSSLDTDSILRATQGIPSYFEHEEVDALVDIYSDSAMIVSGPLQNIQGKEQIKAYWSRYLNPLHMHIRHLGFYSDVEACRQETSIPAYLIHLLQLQSDPKAMAHEAVIQWAEWDMNYEAEDGVIRQIKQPCLIIWKSGPVGWRIEWMATE